ncbi:helix-turn-helix transcriptional regulator [Luteimonas sp. A537]
MGEMSDHYFTCPRSLFEATKIDVDDAISLVVYAKLPLRSALGGSDLITGFIEYHRSGVSAAFLSTGQKSDILARYQSDLTPLEYPVAPFQYESLLEKMVEAGEKVLPLFVHEHHLLVDRRLRVFLFSQLLSELRRDVGQEKVTVQISDSERTTTLASHAWMTPKTLATYLESEGVAPWWASETNLNTHARLERIGLDDTLDLPSNYDGETYDREQMPSFVFGRMLLRRSFRPSGFPSPATPKLFSNAKTGAPQASSGPHRARQQQARMEHRPAKSDLVTQEAAALQEPNAPATPALARQLGSTARHAEEAVRTASSVDDERMLDKKEVAALIGMSVSSVDNLRKTPEFPKHVSYGPNTIRWKKIDIVQWIDQRKEQSPS